MRLVASRSRILIKANPINLNHVVMSIFRSFDPSGQEIDELACASGRQEIKKIASKFQEYNYTLRVHTNGNNQQRYGISMLE